MLEVDDMNKLHDFFRKGNDMLMVEYKRTESVGHSGLKGQDREFFIKKILNEFFPMKHVTGTGKILDPEGNESKQADIVVYNESMPVFDYGNTKYFLSDGVLAHIEVKSNLTTRELTKALQVTKTVKELGYDRNAISLSWRSNGTGFRGSRPIFSCVFAYKGVTLETFKKALCKYYETEADAESMRVDMICVLNSYTFMSRSEGAGQTYFTLETGEDSFMVFFAELFDAMYDRWMRSFSINRYLGKLTYNRAILGSSCS